MVFNTVDPSGNHIFQSINDDDIIILLADSPYSPFDKITNKYVDVTNRSSNETTFDFIYNSGEFFVNTDIIQSTYPHIRST